jgi:hypothetical protein
MATQNQFQQRDLGKSLTTSQPYISRNKVHKFSRNFESVNKGSEVFQHQKPEKVPVYTKFQIFYIKMPYIQVHLE